MMMNRTRPLAAAAASAALSLTVIATATAQETPVTPDTGRSVSLGTEVSAATPVENRYTLVEVAGKALPVETEKGWRCREEVTAGTLVLRGDNHWGLETSVRETCGDRTKVDHEDEDGTYRTEGTTIHFLDDDGDRNDADWSLEREIDLDELDQGSYTDGGTLSVRLADEKTVLRFRRQAP
jgi:hypothetical protein